MSELIEQTKRPKWTVVYNIVSAGSDWVGTGWEFFDDEKTAQLRYDEMSSSDKFTPTKRPYHHGCDLKHLGAAHHWRFAK